MKTFFLSQIDVIGCTDLQYRFFFIVYGHFNGGRAQMFMARFIVYLNQNSLRNLKK